MSLFRHHRDNGTLCSWSPPERFSSGAGPQRIRLASPSLIGCADDRKNEDKRTHRARSMGSRSLGRSRVWRAQETWLPHTVSFSNGITPSTTGSRTVGNEIVPIASSRALLDNRSDLQPTGRYRRSHNPVPSREGPHTDESISGGIAKTWGRIEPGAKPEDECLNH